MFFQSLLDRGMVVQLFSAQWHDVVSQLLGSQGMQNKGTTFQMDYIASHREPHSIQIWLQSWNRDFSLVCQPFSTLQQACCYWKVGFYLYFPGSKERQTFFFSECVHAPCTIVNSCSGLVQLNFIPVSEMYSWTSKKQTNKQKTVWDGEA